MKCLKPTIYQKNGFVVSCGKCNSCIENRRNNIFTQLFLEHQYWGDGSFVTLTYEDDYLPYAEYYPKHGSLERDDINKFIDRFRSYADYHYGVRGLRLMPIGEYGYKNGRAHYHLLIWGLPPHQVELVVNACWTLGKINDVRPIESFFNDDKTLNNTINYVLKHNLSVADVPLQDGQTLPFAVFSAIPAYGSSALPRIAELCRKKNVYPVSGLSHYQKWYMENKTDYNVTHWYGGFYHSNNQGQKSYVFKLTDSQIENNKSPRSGRGTKFTYLSLSRYMLNKLAKMVNPQLYAELQLLDNNNPCAEYAEFRDEFIANANKENLTRLASAEHQEYVESSRKRTDKFYRMYKSNTRTRKI